MFDAKDVRNMKTKNVKSFLVAILGLLGFASCDKVIDIGGVLCMYGQPHADFKALGSVKDETGKPVEGIRVSIAQKGLYTSERDANDTVYTDAKGAFLVSKSVFSRPESVSIIFEDVDGAENGGEFRKAEANPDVVQTKKGDEAWYGGAYEVEADVVMKKEQ